MGRHKKLDGAEGSEGAPVAAARTGHAKWLARVPLLPAVAAMVAIGVCAAAWSTSKISLNFAGGGAAHAEAGRHGSAQDSASRRGRTATTAHKGVVIAFRATSHTATGFTATATIANHSDQTIPRWALAFKIPNAKVYSASNAVLVKPGATVAFLRGLSTAPALRPGQSVRIVFTARGAVARPSACKFNRARCTLV